MAFTPSIQQGPIRQFLTLVFLLLCLFFTTGCPKKADIRPDRGPDGVRPGPQDLPPSSRPIVTSSMKEGILYYKISNTSGRTFHRVQITIRGQECEGRRRKRYGSKIHQRPIFDGATQRFSWAPAAQCEQFKVWALALRPRHKGLRVKIHRLRPPYVTYSIYNLSRTETFRGFLIHITGRECSSRSGFSHRRLISFRRLPPRSKLTQRLRLRHMCGTVRVRVLKMTPSLRRKYLRYYQKKLRRYRNRYPTRRHPTRRPPQRRTNPNRYPEEV